MAQSSLPMTENSPEVMAAYRAAPREQIAQVIDNELVILPRPARSHTRVGSRLAMKLGGPFDLGEGGPGGWVILFEPEIHVGLRPDILVPDLAGWRRDRLPDGLGDESTPAHYDVVPDWICEILSKSTERIDRVSKLRIYRRERVPFVWFVHPTEHFAEVHVLDGERYALVDTFEGDPPVRMVPFDAVALGLAQIFAK